MERAIDAPRDDGYWERLRVVARAADPELALAEHLAAERRRLYRWYPYGEAWRRSAEYEQACAAFDEHVVAHLEREAADDGDGLADGLV